jgi:hypothetical protein
MGEGGYVRAVLCDHPFAYYRLDDPGPIVARDLIGNAPGQYSEPKAGAIAGDPDTSIEISGAAYVDLGGEDAGFPFQGLNTYSLEIWAKPILPNLSASSFPYYLTLASEDDSNSSVSEAYGFDLIGTINQPGASTLTAAYTRHYDAGVAATDTDPSVTVGSWHHVVVTFDGTLLNMWVDGALCSGCSSTTQLPMPRVMNDLVLGAELGGHYTYFLGWLDEVAIYPTVLSSCQIQTHYGIGASGTAASCH